MTVTRHVLSDEPVPPFEPRPGTDRQAAQRLRGGLAGPRAGAAGLHRQERHAVGRPRPLRRHRLGPGGRARRRRPRRRPGVRRRAAVEVVQRALAVRRRGRGQAAGAALLRRPDRADGRRLRRPRSSSPASRRRTCRRGCAARCSWGCPTSTGTCCWRPATRARSPSATPPSTATRPAGSRRSRTCPRRWSGSSPAGATSTPAAGARPSRSRRTRIDKPPSAELAPGQQDSDSLPSYEELDAVIADYVDRDLGMAQLLERGHDADDGGPGPPAGGHGRVQAPPVGTGNEDQLEGVRP